MLDLSGVVVLWHVFALAFGLGLASDTPVRQAFLVEMVGPGDLPNAISLNSATFNSARIVGPALAGVAIDAGGTGWVFLVNALSYVAVLAGLRAMRTADLHPSARLLRAKGQLREGLSYVRSRAGPPRQRTLFAAVLAFGQLEVLVGVARRMRSWRCCSCRPGSPC